MISTETYASADNSVKTELLANLVQDSLNEYTYYAGLAGLKYNMTWNNDGLEVCLCLIIPCSFSFELKNAFA